MVDFGEAYVLRNGTKETSVKQLLKSTNKGVMKYAIIE